MVVREFQEQRSVEPQSLNGRKSTAFSYVLIESEWSVADRWHEEKGILTSYARHPASTKGGASAGAVRDLFVTDDDQMARALYFRASTERR